MDFRAVFESTPGRYLVLDPALRIVAVNDAYLQVTMTRREDVIGRELFEVFPDNAEQPTAMAKLRESLGRVQESLMADTMAVQRYDLRRPGEAGEGFEVRYWSSVNSPVVGPDGRLLYIIHRVEDVTEFVRLHTATDEPLEVDETMSSRATGMELELFERSQELEEANRALRAADETMKSFALALAGASTGLDSVLEAGARTAAELAGAGAVVICTAEDGSLDSYAVHDGDPEVAEALRAFVLSLAADGHQVACGRPTIGPLPGPAQLLDSVTAGSCPAIQRVDLGATVSMALVAEGEYLGCLLLMRHVNERHFGEKDLDQAADVAGRLSLAVFAARSVQRLRASLERLRRSEERHRRVVETLGEAVWEVDEAGVTTFANQRLAQLLGVERDELVGAPAGRFLQAPDRDVLERQIRRGEGHGSDAPFDLSLTRPDGTLVPTRATTTVIHEGVRTRYLYLLTDVTDRMRAEQLQRQLDQRDRLDSLGQLAGGIAHDFNNLLVVMGGFAQLLLERLRSDSPLVPLVHQILSAAVKGSELTGQLLTFGRGGSGQAELLDLQEVLEDLEPMLRRTLGEHVILVVPSASASRPWPVLVSRGALEQAIVNLAANARDAMPGGGRLTIECANTFLDTTALEENTGRAEARFVRLAVSDTGDGMDTQTQQRAFEPFFTTKPVGKGTGLGLATVYGMARNAGGYIRLYSELGIGTAIKIYLPAMEGEPFPDVRRGAALLAPAEPELAQHSMVTRVLVVEDQPEVAELVAEMLRPVGCTVTIATRPREALGLVTDGLEIDLLISDVIMPEMTGPELVEALLRQRPDLPVVYMSGYTAGVLDARGPMPRGSELVEKPFTRATLLAAMTRVLGGAGHPSSSSAAAAAAAADAAAADDDAAARPYEGGS